MPASVPLDAATVTVNGTDVSSDFVPDDQAAHALRDLPLGASTVEARVPGPGDSANDRATLQLGSSSLTGME